MEFKLSRLKSNSPYYTSAMVLLFLSHAVMKFKEAQMKFNIKTRGGEFVSQNISYERENKSI